MTLKMTSTLFCEAKMNYSGHFMILNSGVFFICSNMEFQFFKLGPPIFFAIACAFFLAGAFLLFCSFVKFIYLDTPDETTSS